MYDFVGSEHGQGDRTARKAFEEYAWVITELSSHTQRWYLGRIVRFVEWCEQQQLTIGMLRPMHVAMYLKELREQFSQQTRKPLSTYTLNGHGRTIRRFLYWCAEAPQLYLWVEVPRHLVMPRIRIKAIQPFLVEQMKALMVVAGQNVHPAMRARDQALLAVLLDTGIRAEELCTLTLNHVFINEEEAYIKVIGKSFREREVPLGKRSSRLLMDYIRKYRPKDSNTIMVFLGHRHQPLPTNALRQMFKRWGRRAKIMDVRCSPHTCRHTFAMSFLLQGGDVYILSRLLGHSSVKTTEMYLRAVEAIQARKQGHSVLDCLFGEEESEEEKARWIYLQEAKIKAFVLDGKRKETTREEYAQWTTFFCTWRKRQRDAWLSTSKVVMFLYDVLPDSLQQREGEHPQGFRLRLGTAFRQRFSVFYGDDRLSVRSRPGKRGMTEWQVYQILSGKKKQDVLE